MPRSSTLLTAGPVDAAAIGAATDAIWRLLAADQPGVAPFTLAELGPGVAVQVVAGETVLLTVLRPIELPGHAEVRRLLPSADPSGLPAPVVWTGALTPWTPDGLIGVAVMDRVALLSGGVVIHDVP